MDYIYRKARKGDILAVAELMLKLYGGDNTFDGLCKECIDLLKSVGDVIFVACHGERVVGFSHCSLRKDYVEGTRGGTVGYLEGVFVLPEYRFRGAAKTLVNMCENWAREKGSSEFASDCEFGNEDSYHFHLNVGFKETNRIICFIKEL